MGRLRNGILCLSFFSGAILAQTDNFAEALAAAALERTRHAVRYDGAYVAIDYPGGDVPANMGVCTDVLIRSFRVLGIDLQKRVHEDIKQHFALYPSKKIWGLSGPDTNIDHRRVPNLQVFFQRHGTVKAVSDNPEDYHPGDIVTWMLPGNLPHIGIIAADSSADGTPLVIHNIGRGPKKEDALFRYPITGHYQYPPELNAIDTRE